MRVNRYKLGLSQEGFAARVGLHRTYMSDLEKGKRNVSLRNLVRVAESLGMSPSQLLAEAEELARLVDGT